MNSDINPVDTEGGVADKMAAIASPAPPEVPEAPDISDKYKIPLVFMKESALFGNRKIEIKEYISILELYKAVGTRIDASHIKGLQRVRVFWRIYLDNIEDKVTLMADGVPLRGKVVPVLNTNPKRLDGEQTIRIRVKYIPLSVDDGLVKRTLTLKEIEVISLYREKLRVDEKLTNCETGDRIITVKASTLKSPLPNFMAFGKYSGRVIHPGQKSRDEQSRQNKCSKCLQNGHKFPECPNDWVCTDCGVSGHRRVECTTQSTPDESMPERQHDDSETQAAESTSERQDDGSASERQDDRPGSEEEDDGSSDSSDDSGSGDDEYSTDTSDGESPSKASKSRESSGDRSQAAGGVKQRHNVNFSQAAIDKYLTPNSGRRGVSGERSPPTPVDQLHDKQVDKKRKKHKHKKQKHSKPKSKPKPKKH